MIGIAIGIPFQSRAGAPVIPPGSFQYIVYTDELVDTPASTIYTDGIREVRKRIVGNDYHIDVTLTAIGFTGAENTDWENRIIHTGTTDVFRSGVAHGVVTRDDSFVVDNALDGTGFAGDIDVNWEMLSQANNGIEYYIWRDGVRNGSYVIDKVLSATGFAGVEDVDWENIETHS